MLFNLSWFLRYTLLFFIIDQYFLCVVWIFGSTTCTSVFNTFHFFLEWWICYTLSWLIKSDRQRVCMYQSFSIKKRKCGKSLGRGKGSSKYSWGEQPVEDITNFTCICVYLFVCFLFVSRLLVTLITIQT